MWFKLRGEVANVEVIAVGKSIRELPRLRKAYAAGRWRKLKGIATVEFQDGSLHQAEVPWYEAHGVGRKEFKIKRLVD